jgi:hypothetical protein
LGRLLGLEVGVETVIEVGRQRQFIGQHSGIQFGHLGNLLLLLVLMNPDQSRDEEQQRQRARSPWRSVVDAGSDSRFSFSAWRSLYARLMSSVFII